MLELLRKFYKYNVGTYYIITDIKGYTTILRVDDVGFEALNTEEFINNHIGKAESFNYREKDDQFGFVVAGKDYYLINYDLGLVSI